jgi:RHS repeat-associated protein
MREGDGVASKYFDILASDTETRAATALAHHAMGNVQFLLSDHPTNPGLEKYTYDAFGKPAITGWAGEPRPISSYGNRFLFTGREYLYTLGLYDYRHRIYHPGLGRFIQTDPTGMQIEGAKLSVEQTALYPEGGAPAMFSSSELNLYRYCHNDPVDHSDPFGLEVIGLIGGEIKYTPVDSVTIPGADKYGAIEWGLRPTIVTQPVPGGYTSHIRKLDIVVKRAEVATKFRVKGEMKGRDRTDTQISATHEHEDLHKDISRTFDKDNQTRVFPKAYPTAKEAESKAGDALQQDFNKAQKHDKRFEQIMKKESFR